VEAMDTRTQIAADALGSVRAEGLEPGGIVVQVLDCWVNGAIETEQLGEAAQRLAAGQSVAHLVNHLEPTSPHL
jgi:hypothetical protein